MRILLTGATGFIGSRLLERLADEHEVYALVRRPPDPAHPSVDYVRQNLAEPLDRATLPARVDAVVHQAAVIDADAAVDAGDDLLPFLVNVVGTWRLLRYAADAGVNIFVHASTGGIYGCRDQPFVESDAPNPMDLYSLTKAQAELVVQSVPGDFRRVVLRYFFPYGVGTPNPIPDYVRKAVKGEPIQVLRSRKPTLNPLHVDDAVEATVRALHLDRDAVLNVAGTEPISFAGIAEMAARHVGRAPVFDEIADEAATPYYRADLLADISRMQQILDFTPRIPLKEGTAELIDHFAHRP